jgi:enoyl-CoA hydratase/carnithine racemase
LIIQSDFPEIQCAVLGFNRPEALNALNGLLLDALDAGLDSLESAPGIKAVIITGDTRCFSVGGDLKENYGDADVRVRRMHALALRLQSYPKITIAAIEG